jgi:hypothetical protein
MTTRAVSGAKLLTPLAVLVPILGAPLGAVWIAHDHHVSALLLLVGGLTAVAAAGYLTYGLGTSIAAAVLTWVAMILSFPVFWIISINTSICGKDIAAGWAWLPPTAGLVIFPAVGAWGLRTRHGSWGVPLGYVVGFAVMVALLAAVPGTPGFCET